MSVKYLETDVTDEGPIRWYEIDGETYGFDSEGVVLDAGGSPISDDVERRVTLRQIAKFEAFK
jgi:hypothetical protein